MVVVLGFRGRMLKRRVGHLFGFSMYLVFFRFGFLFVGLMVVVFPAEFFFGGGFGFMAAEF